MKNSKTAGQNNDGLPVSQKHFTNNPGFEQDLN
jgi:hypothetical protein